MTAHLYFGAALSASIGSSGTRLRPLADLKTPLAPHERFAQRILLALQALGYIEPELSPSWAEDWIVASDWLTRGFENLSWRVLRPSGDTQQVLSSWAEDHDIVEKALATWVDVWVDLALAEVAGYARSALAEAGFNPQWADGAGSALVTGVKYFSVDKVMYLIHIALRSLAMAHQRGSVYPTKPAHVFSTSLQAYVKRARTEGWSIRGVARPSDPPSAIAVLFADEVTGLGDRYYTERPCLEALVETLHANRLTI